MAYLETGCTVPSEIGSGSSEKVTSSVTGSGSSVGGSDGTSVGGGTVVVVIG